MSQELQKINRELTPKGETILRKIERTYGKDYPAKPASASMEQLADTREVIPTLFEIRQIKDQTFCNALVTNIIVSILSKHVNVIRGMDADMVGACAQLIIERYPLMNPADIKYFMTKGVIGEYGKILDRVDSAMVLSWCAQYWEQMKHLIRLRKENTEKHDPKVPVPDEIVQLSEKLRIQQVNKAKNVLPESRLSLQEEYARRGIDINQRIEETNNNQQ